MSRILFKTDIYAYNKIGSRKEKVVRAFEKKAPFGELQI